jgi:hypothetical protein
MADSSRTIGGGRGWTLLSEDGGERTLTIGGGTLTTFSGGDANADGEIVVVTASLIPGSTGDVSIDGQILSRNITVISGVASSPVNASVSGQTLSRTVSLIAGSGGEEAEIDGNKILEITFQEIQSLQYRESDYYSIYSAGERSATGLITATQYGFQATVAPPSSCFDNNYANSGGSGWLPTFETLTTGPAGAHLYFAEPVAIAGFRFIGSDEIDDNGDTWKLVAGFDQNNIWPEPYGQNFDAFTTAQATAEPISDLYRTEIEFNPRISAKWNYYAIQMYPEPRATTGERFAEELEIAVFHSNLDGGDRRTTNGNPSKRCAITLGPGWTYRAQAGSDLYRHPEDAWVDGSVLRSNSPHDATLDNVAMIGTGANGGTPMSTVGAYIQFVYPREVIQQRFVLQTQTQEVYDSGDEPTKYGKWHWEYSKNNGATWVPIGSTWWFYEAVQHMLAPHTGETFGRSGDVDLGDGATHWRMVLDEGPAFGGINTYEIVFDLIDSESLIAALGIEFTDDADGLLPTATVTSESAYTVKFTDGTDDVITATIENLPNPLLDITFTDEGEFTARGNFEPTMFVQTVVVATGR